MPKDVSICVLLYGDFPLLAHRCLQGIERQGDFERIQDVRLGLNEVSEETERLVREFAERTQAKCPVLVFQPRQNVFKYPLMRRMFRDPEHPLAPWVMWFDDDSCLVECPNWWGMISEQMRSPAVIGQLWSMRLQGGQQAWIASQPWCRQPPQALVRFATGGWWLAPSEWLLRNDWPLLEIKHRGGDVLLGELARQTGMPLSFFDVGVWINSDANGAHCKSPRRGFDEAPCGAHYRGEPLSVDHQRFECVRTAYWLKPPSFTQLMPQEPLRPAPAFLRLP